MSERFFDLDRRWKPFRVVPESAWDFRGAFAGKWYPSLNGPAYPVALHRVSERVWVLEELSYATSSRQFVRVAEFVAADWLVAAGLDLPDELRGFGIPASEDSLIVPDARDNEAARQTAGPAYDGPIKRMAGGETAKQRRIDRKTIALYRKIVNTGNNGTHNRRRKRVELAELFKAEIDQIAPNIEPKVFVKRAYGYCYRHPLKSHRAS
jgi:hypothetical protein